MAIRKANVTPEESIKQNLEHFCFEVGSVYEQFSVRSAKTFIAEMGQGDVIDLGCGDGAATQVFVNNGNKVIAVDINPEKLAKIKGAEKIQEDFLTFLNKPIQGSVFMHHSLEHFVNPEEVLRLIGDNLQEGSLCYIAVPFGEEPHSVHHVSFENYGDITPPNTTVLKQWERKDNSWPEIGVIVRK